MEALTRTENVEEELARAYPYRLLGRLLSAAPDDTLLEALSAIEGDDTPFGQAYGALARAAKNTSAADSEREYQRLFIGVGRGELVPFASFYLTGFLHEKPLAKLRGDLANLGIARADDVVEPEDHIAALCEVMAGLITGELADADLAAQKQFFDAHIANWALRFFSDLEQAKGAGFYRAVGALGSVLLTVEAQAFDYVKDRA